MSNIDSRSWSSRLPADYGEGQRQFDMISAAARAVQPWIWTSAVLAGALAVALLHNYFAVLIGVPVYWFSMRPVKRALAQASDEWAREREAWARQFD